MTGRKRPLESDANYYERKTQHFGIVGIATDYKVKLSLYRPWRPLGLREFEAPTFSDIRLVDGGKVVSPTRRLLFTLKKIPCTYFC
jgi:hypothetical protein